MLEIELETCKDPLRSHLLQSFNVYVNKWKGVTDEAKRDEEKEQLREEKKQLREEKKQLLEEKKQLLEKENQLRQEKMTLALLGSSKRSIPASPGT
jgi:phage-related minor tail protein